MSKIVGYMLTWTTYGSWLPGDQRRYVANGKNLPGDIRILEKNRRRQKSPTVRLNAQEQEVAKQSILAEAKQLASHGYTEITLLGMNVNSWGLEKVGIGLRKMLLNLDKPLTTKDIPTNQSQ